MADARAERKADQAWLTTPERGSILRRLLERPRMQGKKELLSRVMHRLQLLRLLKVARRDLLVIFGWHRVTADGPRPPHLFADDVVGTSVSDFEAQLRWIQANARILSEPELLELVAAGRGPRELSVLITFDDGYVDNYELAYPVLRRLGIPAVFFIPSKRIEDRELGWVDEIPYLLKQTTKSSLRWGEREFRLPTERAGAIAHLHKVMQLERAATTRDLLPRLSELCAVERPSPEVQSRELMTWAQLREVAANGVSIGSHTHSHRVLATLDPDEQREEIHTAKALLESRLGSTIDTIAYPVGGYRHFTEDTRRIAKEAGHRLGYSFCTGVNRFGRVAPFDVKRIGPPPSIDLLAGTTVLPEVFDWDQVGPYGASTGAA